MARMVGYMVTWTTYGTWLQGEKHVSYQSESPFRNKDKENIGLATAKRVHCIGIKSAEQIMKSEAETIYEKLRQKRPSGPKDLPLGTEDQASRE